MAVKTYKPYTPSRRYMSGLDSGDITAKRGQKPLKKLPTTAGRNSGGRITSRHKEAARGKHYRLIDFKRNKFGIQGKVTSIEYDPYRNCRIAPITIPMATSATSSSPPVWKWAPSSKRPKRIWTSSPATR